MQNNSISGKIFWVLFTALIIGCSHTTYLQEKNISSSSSRKRSGIKKTTVGYASYYGKKFQGRRTASGEKFNMNALTAAHRTLPFGTICRVTNLQNNKSVTVRINDRGPVKRERIIDLSYAAAKKLEAILPGIIRVRIEVLRLPR